MSGRRSFGPPGRPSWRLALVAAALAAACAFAIGAMTATGERGATSTPARSGKASLESSLPLMVIVHLSSQE